MCVWPSFDFPHLIASLPIVGANPRVLSYLITFLKTATKLVTKRAKFISITSGWEGALASLPSEVGAGFAGRSIGQSAFSLLLSLGKQRK